MDSLPVAAPAGRPAPAGGPFELEKPLVLTYSLRLPVAIGPTF